MKSAPKPVSLERKDVLKRVVSIIAEYSGVSQKKILETSDLSKNLGIVGDDGYELLEAIGKEYEIDWSELDSGVIFGGEPLGLTVPPWDLYPSRWNGYRYNCDMYETESKTVADIVDSICLGKWKQKPPILKPLRQQRRIFLWSCVVYLAIPIVLGGLVIAAWLSCGIN